ncbi:carboxylating nicotinate-nucleotide diphosphorylase [Haloglycomyces albus]|uniref:carboxylating nicotinate-nucleotide diphosphorylase n=1 Tax=Haloglycomyces albus TaxID=526067 RepID=UPI0004A2B42C|nr:carboxylating nicotinate-nucleotide diphosphorylase [Haloglycomyces albus]
MTDVADRISQLALDPERTQKAIGDFLTEDLSPQWSDVTSEAIFSADETTTAHLVPRDSGILAGLPLAHAVFAQLPGPVEFEYHATEGTHLNASNPIASVTAPVRSLLAAERTALNLLSRLCGIATHTRDFVELVENTSAQIVDTRKTTPGLREFEKYAVRAAGGGNKRMGLYDVAMIKDNHKEAAGSITAAFNAVRGANPDIDVQVEVESMEEAVEATAVGAAFLLVDNLSPKETREIVEVVGDRTDIEATGGITLENVGEYAVAGVDFISIGALTHSSPIVDIGLDL